MKTIEQYISGKTVALLTEHIIKGHLKKQIILETVDLDLPSGTLWCTCNLGANNPEEYGLYFQWGCLDGVIDPSKSNNFLSEDNYKTYSTTEYDTDSELFDVDDAAYQLTKGKYKIPSYEDLVELENHTTSDFAIVNGVKGRKFISKKDDTKWIFIPFAGVYIVEKNDVYSAGYSTSLRSASFNDANDLTVHSMHIDKNDTYTPWDCKVYDSYPIRPILNK